MTTLSELSERIKAKLEELADDKAEVERARKLVHRKALKLDTIRDELAKAKRRVQRRREVVEKVRELLKDASDEDKEQLSRRLDRLSGELEEAISYRDHLLDRIDRMKDKLYAARQLLIKIEDESQEDREALQRMRERRRRIREANDRPSPNFTWAEFDCNDGTPLPEESKPAVRDWCVRIGEPARERFGSIHINSGFRHAAYNARIGGEPNSVHIYDYPGRDYKAVAVDWTAASGTPRDWFNFTLGRAAGRGLYATFHHADSRDNLGWDDAIWTG